MRRRRRSVWSAPTGSASKGGDVGQGLGGEVNEGGSQEGEGGGKGREDLGGSIEVMGESNIGKRGV